MSPVGSVGNDADGGEDVDDAKDGLEYDAVAEVGGNGFQQNGNPKNTVRLDRTCGRIRVPVLV